MDAVKKQVSFLIKLKQKKYRDKEQKFLLESPKVILEQFDNPLLDSVYVTEDFFVEYEDHLVSRDIFKVSASDMKKISSQVHPVGIVALFDIPQDKKFNFRNKNILLLDTIQDPGNMGTIIRTADWYGFDSIFLNEACVDIYNPKVIAATMGSIFNINVYSDVDLVDFMGDLKENNYKVIASSLQGKKLSLAKLDKTALIIGNESKGISSSLLNLADLHYKIPQYGKAESLNASVAAGVIMNEVKRMG